MCLQSDISIFFTVKVVGEISFNVYVILLPQLLTATGRGETVLRGGHTWILEQLLTFIFITESIKKSKVMSSSCLFCQTSSPDPNRFNLQYYKIK